ncbi:universal stress protein [Cysteiniphilum sp. 6C5]|uniref:universal stress protein n=1 Tax=unclassified Cysteiniphilum TaxID=2610889 RepID=UPI003F860726
MQRFNKIALILQLDQNNAQTIEYAASITTTNDANLIVICAHRSKLSDSDQKHIDNTLKQQLLVKYDMVFLTGHPVVEITTYCHANKIDLAILAADNAKGMKRFFFGSLSMSLMRKAPCPIWVTRPIQGNHYKRILICVDPCAEDVNKKTLNTKLIEIGTSFARYEMAECHMVCAWNLPEESTLKSPFIRTPEHVINQLKMNKKVEVAKAYQTLQQEFADRLTNCQTHLIYGEPVKAISEFTVEHKIDLVIMGTLARSGPHGFVMGNTAEAIINQLECSIMAIKPDGFVSPLVRTK